MKPSIAAKLAQLTARLDEVNHLLSSEEAARDMDQFRKLNRERAELEPVVEHFHAWQNCEADIAAAQEMAADPEMREFAAEEVEAGKERLKILSEKTGVFRCRTTFSCTEACPRGIEVTKAIQEVKRSILFDRF